MSSPVYLFVTLACLSHVMIAIYLANVEPTKSNSTGLFWIASDCSRSGCLKQGSVACNASYCHIVCNGERSCEQLNVHATSSLTTLVIECNGYYACYSARFNASNIAKSLNVTCGPTDIYPHEYNCESTRIYCPTDAPCNIHCLGYRSCQHTNFYIAHKWTKALNFENMCLGYGSHSSIVCAGAIIRCIDTGLDTKLIYNDPMWDCTDYNCCPHVKTIACPTDVPCEIDCDAQTCNNPHIIATDATSLTLNCGIAGCQGAQVECPAGADSSCNILCPSDRSCQDVSVQGTNTVDHLSLDCAGSHACQYMQLQMDSAEIMQLDLNCSASYSCRGLNASLSSMTSVINYLNIDCTDSHACDSATISATVTSTARVNCVNQFISTSHYSGACQYAKFHIYGGVNHKNQRSNISYVCGAYDCYGATLNGSNLHSIVLQCNSPYACSEAMIDASQSGQLSLECSGSNGCESSSISCPSSGLCDIDCLKFDACTAMNTNVTSESYSKLDFNCNGPAYGCGQEQYPRVYCMDSGAMSKLIWSSHDQNARCYGDCCPVYIPAKVQTRSSPSPVVIVMVILAVVLIICILAICARARQRIRNQLDMLNEVNELNEGEPLIKRNLHLYDRYETSYL
eukprot:194651_1